MGEILFCFHFFFKYFGGHFGFTTKITNQNRKSEQKNNVIFEFPILNILDIDKSYMYVSYFLSKTSIRYIFVVAIFILGKV